MPVATEIRELERGDFARAAELMSDAFLDDPGFLAVGPDRRRPRRNMQRRYHRAALAVAQRWGRPIYGAFRDGEIAGVAITFAAGRHPAPAWSFGAYAPAFLLAGPGPIVRGLRTAAVQDRGHPPDEHVHVWFLAVAPAHQRSGVGRALLGRVFEQAAAPVYLDTANPANVPYYASLGFEQIGDEPLPRGAHMWFMLRPMTRP